MAFGVAACGDDDDETAVAAAVVVRRRRRVADRLLVASAAGRFASAVRGRDQGHQARAEAEGRQVRRLHHQVRVARRRHGGGRQVGAGRDLGERPQGRAGRHGDRLHRRVQLRCVGDLDPDQQRGRHPAGQPVEHGSRSDQGRRGRRAGRAGQVLPDRRAQLRSRRADRHHPGRRPGAVHEGRGRHQRVHPRRRRGVRQGRREEHADRGGGARHQDRRQRLVGRQGVELPGARLEDQGQRRRRRLHGRHHRQQRAAAVQGPERGDAGRQAVRPRRRRDRGLHQGDPGRRSRRRRT